MSIVFDILRIAYYDGRLTENVWLLSIVPITNSDVNSFNIQSECYTPLNDNKVILFWNYNGYSDYCGITGKANTYNKVNINNVVKQLTQA